MAEKRKLLIYGAGGHGKVVLDAALAADNFVVRGILDDDPCLHGKRIHGIPVLGGWETLKGAETSDCLLVVAVGCREVRQRLVARLEEIGCRFARVIHPSAVLGRGAEVGEGTVVLPAAVVHTDARVGRHAIVNTGATIDHDCRIEDFVHISPGAHLAGAVYVASGVHVGIGASIAPGVRIGADAVVGAGAAVIDDVPQGSVVAGVPARAVPRDETDGG